MSFDYDLVVIGSTLEGIYAARKAVLLQARVALVTQTKEEYLNYNSFIYNNCLNEITKSIAEFGFSPWEVCQENSPVQKPSLAEIKNWGNLVRENITAENSLGDLSILGVDVIYGKGEFCRLPKQAFLVNNRQLLSRNYLLATGAKYRLKSDYQTQSLNCFTPDNLWSQNLDKLPQSVVIIGDSHRSLELAQGLARLGKKVTLATSNKRLLSEEVVEASRLFQAQFAADGIEVLLNSPLTQVKVIEGKTWIQLGNNALEIEAAAIIFTDIRQPNIAGLNLEGVGVKFLDRGIVVNEQLQTTNKSIYACGDLLGGHSLPHTAQYEVDIALKNMLSFSWFKKDYRYLPTVILTQPNFARVGLTKIKIEQNNKDIYFVKQHFKTNLSAQISGLTAGWGQFIIKTNGEILGCTILGNRAIELINIIAMMIRQKIKLSRNPIQGLLKQEISYVEPSFTEILNRVTIAFHQQKLQRDKKLRNRLETWFVWRR